MTQHPNVRKFAATNRLAELIVLPGGKTVREALDDAQTAVEQYRPEVIDDIDARIAELERLSTEASPSAETMYRASAGVIEHAGLFGLGHVGRAAYSLCELVDRLQQRGTWDAAAVAVHVGSMRLLRDMGENPEAESGAGELLAGLHAVVAKVGAGRDAPTEG